MTFHPSRNLSWRSRVSLQVGYLEASGIVNCQSSIVNQPRHGTYHHFALVKVHFSSLQESFLEVPRRPPGRIPGGINREFHFRDHVAQRRNAQPRARHIDIVRAAGKHLGHLASSLQESFLEVPRRPPGRIPGGIRNRELSIVNCQSAPARDVSPFRACQSPLSRPRRAAPECTAPCSSHRHRSRRWQAPRSPRRTRGRRR